MTKRLHWSEYLLLTTLVGVVGLRMAIVLRYPFGVDQGVFAWLGMVVTDGGRPYLDAWDTKGPGVFAFSGLLALLGGGIRTMRLVDLLLQLIATASLFRFTLSRAPLPIRLIAPGSYLIGYLLLGFHETSQPDSWCSALLVIGFLPAFAHFGDRDEEPLPWTSLLSAGLVVGIASTMKPTYAVLGGAPLVLVFALTAGRDTGVRLRALGMLLFGVTVPLALCVAWLASLGALRETWNVVIGWNSQVYVGAPVPPSLLLYRMALGFLESVPWAPVGVLAVLLSALRWRDPRIRLALVWAFTAWVEVTAQQKFWAYQWTPLLAPMAILLAKGTAGLTLGSSRAWEQVPVQRLRLAVGVWGLWLTLPMLGRVRAEWPALRTAGPEEWAPLGYADRLDGMSAVVRRIQALTPPTEPVFFFGTLTVGNYLANRPAPSRLAMARPLVDGEGTDVRETYRREFWRDWARQAPAVVVTYSASHCARTPAVRWMCLPAYPALADRLAVEYEPAETIGAFSLYRRRSGV